MAISFVNAGTLGEASSGNITVTPPTTQTDDIMILGVSSHDNVAITLPAGWTIIAEANNTSALRATIAWKRCVGAEAAFTVTHSAGDGIVGNVSVYRGCTTENNVIHKFSQLANASSSTCTGTAIIPVIDGCMMLFIMHDSDNGASSAQAGVTLGNMTERFDSVSTLGLDQAVSLSDLIQNVANTTGSLTGTLSLGPDVNSGSAIALRSLNVGFSNNYQFAKSISAAVISVTEKIR